jgi:uncharacterized protein YqeY
MSLKEKLEKDLVEAMKSKDALRLSVLRMAKAALQKRQMDKLQGLIDARKKELAEQQKGVKAEDLELKADEIQELKKRAEIDDVEVQKVLANLIKQRRDSVEQFTKGNRPELANKELEEIKIIQGYMPETLGQAEIEKIIDETIRDVGATSQKDIGTVMKALMPKFSGKGVDGKLVNTLVRQKLS